LTWTFSDLQHSETKTNKSCNRIIYEIVQQRSRLVSGFF